MNQIDNQNKLDYNYKLDEFTIYSNRISKTIYSEEEIPIIRVNIWYPVSSDETFEAGKEQFNSFFYDLANEFIDFVEKRMTKKIVKGNDINHPYSAVMKFVPTFENEKYISLIVDSFVYTEKGKSKIKRLAFTFEKTNGNIVISEDLYDGLNNFLIEIYNENTDKKNVSKIKKAFSKSDFYLVPNGVIFFYEDSNGINTMFFEKNNFI